SPSFKKNIIGIDRGKAKIANKNIKFRLTPKAAKTKNIIGIDTGKAIITKRYIKFRLTPKAAKNSFNLPSNDSFSLSLSILFFRILIKITCHNL
ncbi:MAG: hypothetical protein JRE18_01310, partial [Deltaproteobacteria bacterium]|nr:hypothetical protein [Deltaproteobacteria bacterium]